MATPVIMPRQGQSVESCIVSKWHKSKGDQVKVGDLLFTYETDKATFDEEAKVEGTLLEVYFQEGDDVPCLLNMCVIGNPGESTQEFNPNGAEAAPAEEAPKAQEYAKVEVQPEAAPAAVMAEGDRLKISPRARNLAERAGVDYRYAAASGPEGRIVEKDIVELQLNGPKVTSAARDEYLKLGADASVSGTGLGGRITTGDLSRPAAAVAEPQQAKAAGAAEPLYDEVKVPNIRKVIAKAMQASLNNMAQLTLNASFDATEVMAFRKKLKEGKDRLALENITLNDVILYAVSRTLENHKDLNANFVDDKMLYFRNVHLGVACDTDRGLMVPVVANANLKSLNQISREVKGLVKEAQKGILSPDATRGGSFTITNLGTLGIESFTPVINPPQTGILGVNNIVQRAREVDGEIEFYPAMGLSLTFDHRALDGAPAARFLQDLKNNLENFTALLAK